MSNTMNGESWMVGSGDALHIPLPDRSVDLVVGSPPYIDARLYLEDGRNLGIARILSDWIAWMLEVTDEALRVSRGAVIWVVAGVTRDRTYQPGPEGLLYEWIKAGGSGYRPVYWHRYGIPGNGGDDWFRSDIEHCLCFKRPGALPWSDNTAMGEKPKCGPGGRMTNRTANGERVRAFSVQTRRGRDGKRDSSDPLRPMPEIANPGNIFSTGAGGGGKLGHDAAHENEAPYPVDVPHWFIASLCPPGGLVLDPYSGSGTTVEAAVKLGRRAIGFDLRGSQARLAHGRLSRPHALVKKAGRDDAPLPLFAGGADR